MNRMELNIGNFTNEMLKYQEDKRRWELQDKLDDLFLMYLDSKECDAMTFEQLEMLRKYHTYLRDNA